MLTDVQPAPHPTRSGRPTSTGAGTLLALGCAWALGCTPNEPVAGSEVTTTGSSASSDTAATSSGPDASDAGSGPLETTTSTAETGSPGSTTDTGEATTTSESTGLDKAGLGMISGRCGLIDAREIDSTAAFTFANAIDFGRLGFDYDLLTPEGQQVYNAGTLGGSSLHSEVIAFEILTRCEGAALLATESEIEYLDPSGTKTDLLVEVDGRTVGVSVTRAVGFPHDAPYTEAQAAELLSDKLEDILASTANVTPAHAWAKQILHVVAFADMHAQSIYAAYAGLPPETTADTVLVVTVSDGNDAFLY